MRVALEGNIGSGKSTLLGCIEAATRARAVTPQPPAPIRVICEPIDDWCRPLPFGSGASALQMAYADSGANGMAFQLFAMATRSREAMAAPSYDRAETVVYERNPFDVHIFPRLNHALGVFSDFDMHAFAAVAGALAAARPDLVPTRHIYLRTPVDTCLRRVRARDRAQEAGITAEYLSQLHRLHEEWYVDAVAEDPSAVLVLDGDLPSDGHADALQAFFTRIRSQAPCGRCPA